MKTADLTPGVVLVAGTEGEFEVLSTPVPANSGRVAFEARDLASGKVETHHAQAHWEWEVR